MLINIPICCHWPSSHSISPQCELLDHCSVFYCCKFIVYLMTNTKPAGCDLMQTKSKKLASSPLLVMFTKTGAHSWIIKLEIQHLCMCWTFTDLCQWLAKALSCTAFGCFFKHFLFNMIYRAVFAR